MSTRCIACDCKLSELELSINKDDGSLEDMCTKCLESIYEDEEEQ